MAWQWRHFPLASNTRQERPWIVYATLRYIKNYPINSKSCVNFKVTLKWNCAKINSVKWDLQVQCAAQKQISIFHCPVLHTALLIWITDCMHTVHFNSHFWSVSLLIFLLILWFVTVGLNSSLKIFITDY